MFCTFLGLQPRGYINDNGKYTDAWHEVFEFEGMQVYPARDMAAPGDFHSLDAAIDYLRVNTHHAEVGDITPCDGYTKVVLWTSSIEGTESDEYIIIIEPQSVWGRMTDWFKDKFYPKPRFYGSDVVDVIHTWLLTFTVCKLRGKLYDVRLTLCRKFFVSYFLTTKRFVFNILK